VLHISIWENEAFSGGLIGDGTEFWALCDSLTPPNWGVWSAADTALVVTEVEIPSLRVARHLSRSAESVFQDSAEMWKQVMSRLMTSF